MAKYVLQDGGVYDTEEFRFIPEDGGRYWGKYLEWKDAGNSPDPKPVAIMPTTNEIRATQYEKEWMSNDNPIEVVVAKLVKAVVSGDNTALTELKTWVDQVDSKITR